jgi:hypothetical protein
MFDLFLCALEISSNSLQNISLLISLKKILRLLGIEQKLTRRLALKALLQMKGTLE